MSLPILLNIRAIQKDSPYTFYFALDNYSYTPSGLLLRLDYDEDHKYPWGVTINKIQGNEFGYFSNLAASTLQKISSAFSSYLNSYNGFEQNSPKALKLGEIMLLSEKIVTLVDIGPENDRQVRVQDCGVELRELLDSLAKTELPFLMREPDSSVINPQKFVDASVH